MTDKAIEMLSSGEVKRVIGWRRGEFVYDVSPSVFESIEDVRENLVYNSFCGSNLSKYLVRLPKIDGRTLIFLKPCDSYSLLQLIKEYRVKKEDICAVGIECFGKTSGDLVKAKGVEGITAISENFGTLKVITLYGEESIPLHEVYLEKCSSCKSKKHPIFDIMLGEEGEAVADSGRFDGVKELEALTPEQRYNFWQGELSRCIRCNACREVCPACTCETCIFDNPLSGISQKVASDSFEEQMYHIIRAFHVAGRCTDCGECSRVCPQNIPLHLLNRKFISDINGLYGEYQAGQDEASRPPLGDYKESDPEPNVKEER